MLAIVDHRLKTEIKERLSFYAKLIEFKTSGITYNAISGHPDIFMCQMDNLLIYSPSLPIYYIDLLKLNNINIEEGETLIGEKYPFNIAYNAVVTKHFFIHNYQYTDPVIIKNIKERKVINVKQGYTRCSILPVNDNSFIVSDKGVYEVLKKEATIDVLLINNDNIIIEDFKNGFIGGTAGICYNKCFFAGNLNYHKQGNLIKNFINSKKIEIIELGDYPLSDCGSIIFF
ncbi:MAG: hypothetical protein A2X12_02735 [Bacteroidetes bacterium GWE2_29_8]|nr:MAG: hypothetical protein A2X12_02735 [Bacteroidetes bacterium GWE2_29_8]OFY20090.1 MAG: hypothetical protein A2X02_06930 [Bacteroidetes bacterium GWF2_29_10]